MNTQKILDRIISDSILTDKILPNHKLCKIDGTLYMDTVTTLYFDDFTIEYANVRGEYFIKTTYHYIDTIRKEACHTDTYFKLINIKRKNFIKSLLFKLVDKHLLTIDHSEKPPFYNISRKKTVLYGYTHKQQNYNMYLDYIKPQHLDEFLPLEVSLSTQEVITMNQLDIIKYLVKNVL